MSDSATDDQTTPTQPLDVPPHALEVGDPPMTEPLPIGTVLKDIYRVTALLTDTPSLRVYRVAMLEEGEQCAKCGATLQEGDQFCEDCGAQIEEQTALLQETPASAPAGAGLLADLPADEVTEMRALPPVREVLVGGDSRYAVLPERGTLMGLDSMLSGEDAVLDEADTLRIGHSIAHSLAFLHSKGLALGRLTLADLAITTQREVVLADGSAIRRSQGPEDERDDVHLLGRVLEKLAGIERQTKRLDETDISGPVTRDLATILSNIRTGTIHEAALLAQALDILIAQRTTASPLRTRTGYASDPGMVRDYNEDSLLVWDFRTVWNNQPTNLGLYVVADGMGGHEGGEIASGIAIQTIAQNLTPTLLEPALREGSVDASNLADRVKQAITQANQAIYEESLRRGNDMGTTLTMAVVVGDIAVVGNVGDSRTYLYRGGQLQRVSKDHSLVQRLVDLGQIEPDDVYSHPNKNAILRSLGDSGDLDIDTFEVRLQTGDALLLCSDGQWEMVRDPAMAKIIGDFDAPANAADALIKAANAAGGEDNVTSVLVRFTKPAGPERNS
ncbi:MAG TPA: protein phosphatase 2C domain-containing protein [Herpetosiphonaceae bacterium]